MNVEKESCYVQELLYKPNIGARVVVEVVLAKPRVWRDFILRVLLHVRDSLNFRQFNTCAPPVVIPDSPSAEKHFAWSH